MELFSTILSILLLLSMPMTGDSVDKEEQVLLPGQEAPKFFANILNGGEFFLSRKVGARARAGKKGPVAFSFFTTSCIPCRKEIPHIIDLQEKYPDVDFYLFNVGDDPKLVDKYVKKMNFTLPVCLDRWGMVAKKFNASVTPAFVIINAEGIVTFFKKGFHEGDEKIIEKHIRALFPEKYPQVEEAGEGNG